MTARADKMTKGGFKLAAFVCGYKIHFENNFRSIKIVDALAHQLMIAPKPHRVKLCFYDLFMIARDLFMMNFHQRLFLLIPLRLRLATPKHISVFYFSRSFADYFV
jgi:hypothetical protein